MSLTILPDLECDKTLELMEHAVNATIAVDTESGETKGCLGISIAFKHPLGVFSEYLPLRHNTPFNLTEKQISRLWDIFSRSTLVFHHAAYDLWVLSTIGYRHTGKFYCTMLCSHWINENRSDYSLDATSRFYGGEPKTRPLEMQFIIDTDGWDFVPLSMMRIYSAQDAFITYEAFEKEIYPEFVRQGFDTDLWHVWECAFLQVMYEMSKVRGVRIDPEFCIKEILRGEAAMRECFRALGGINPGSRIGLKKLLLEELSLPVVSRSVKTGEPSFDKKAMEQYDSMLEASGNPLAKIVLRYRGWQKTVSSNYKAYMDLMDHDGILHPNFKLHGTRTGRLSCEKPNLQQIPRDSENEWNGGLKRAFIPREGYRLWTADYSQLEFRLAASYAEEPTLIAIFNDPSRKLFKEMATELQWDYEPTKRFNYSTLYGGGAANTSRIFSVSIIAAKRLINEYYTKYPGLRKVMRQAEFLCKKRGYVQDWAGRRRHFPNRAKDGHKAFNAIIQSGGFQIVKRAMVRLRQLVCDENCQMVLQVHDEVVFEIREGMEDHYLPRIKEVMEDIKALGCPDFGVPFPVEIGVWGSK